MPEQEPVAGARGRPVRADGDRRDHEPSLRAMWRVIVSHKLGVRVLTGAAGALLLEALGSSELAGLAGLVLGSLLGEEIDALARRARTRNIWLLSAVLGLLYKFGHTVMRWVRGLFNPGTTASAPVTPTVAAASAAPIFSAGALACAGAAGAISAALFTASAAAGGPSPIPGPESTDGSRDAEILGFSKAQPAKPGKLPRDAAEPGERYEVCDPTSLWAIVRFDRDAARFSARTTARGRPFARYSGRAHDGFAELQAHSYGSAIPTGDWIWRILVGGKERERAEVTLVDSCP